MIAIRSRKLRLIAAVIILSTCIGCDQVTKGLFRRRRVPFTLFMAMLFMLAGGIGNLIHRVSNNGLVTDFLNIGIGPVRTGIFNVADVSITFGAIASVFLWRDLQRHSRS